MVRTTPPKEDKVDTSSAEVPTAQALAAQSRSKALDDSLVDDDPVLLNFDAVESKIVCWTSSRLWKFWPDSGKPNCPFRISDCLIFVTSDAGPPFLVLGHENVEGGY
jgi:hypothetical protein